ncbi:MAG: acyl carrier protein [Chitinophagaceae bacterium]
MTEQEMFAIMTEILEVNASDLTDEIGPGDIPSWDSLGHIKLISTLEKKIDFELSSDDLMRLESVLDFKQLFIR